MPSPDLLGRIRDTVAKFEPVWDAGHASTEPGIVDALVRAGDEAYTL